MKTQIQNFVWMSAILLTSCGQTDNAEKEHKDDHQHDQAHQHIYACPMHPEVTGKEGEKCPKCGMNLEHNDNSGKTNGNSYYMQFSGNPTEIEAGKEAILAFAPKIKGKENEAIPLDVVHEKKLHLIIVSNDLAYFEHIHPEYQPDGTYQINVLPQNKDFTNGRGHNETRFENGGDYTLFADYLPTGATHQLEKINLTVKGTPYKKINYDREKLIYSNDGITVSLDAEGGWTTNKQMHIKAIIKKGNKLFDANLCENYLSAKGHMVILKTETFEYLHVHPNVENGCLDLHTTFESAGTYRGWLQFQIDGKLITSDFVIVVKEGGSNSTSEDSHDHKSDGHSH